MISSSEPPVVSPAATKTPPGSRPLETVKRLFEQEDSNAGPFGYRVIRENRDKGGIIDI